LSETEKEKTKPEIRKEFDDNAIKWAARIGIEDVAVAKTLYWCVLNIYTLQQEVDKLKKESDDRFKTEQKE